MSDGINFHEIASSEAQGAELAEIIGQPDGYVRLLVHPADSKRHLAVPAPVPDATLELAWQLSSSSTRRGPTATIAATDPAANQEGLLELDIDPAGELRVGGQTAVRSLCIVSWGANVTLAPEVDCTRITARGGARISGAMCAGCRLDSADGIAELEVMENELVVHHLQGGALLGNPDALPLRVDFAEGVELRDVVVSIPANGQIVDCWGRVVLQECKDATVRGDPVRTLEVAVVDGITGSQLAEAVLVDIILARDTLSRFLGASSEITILDPLPSSISQSLSASKETAQDTSATELLHERLSAKARRPHTVDAAAKEVLNARKRAASNWSFEGLLLKVYGGLGYGRSLFRPLLIWFALVCSLFVLRLFNAMQDPEGKLGGDGGLAPTWELLALAGDMALTIVLLPLSFNRSTPGIEYRVGLEGGYLLLARVALAVPLLVAGIAAQRLLRVRISKNSRR